jgi:hypothetical protein
MVFAQKLTNLQIELIRLFSYQIPDNQIVEIKDLLAKYFAEVATREMDKLWDENQWNNDTMETWSNEHLRTPYKD